MSDFGAIAGVSRTLRTLLADRMEFAPYLTDAPAVTIGTPRADAPGAELAEAPRVNLFLYRVAEQPQLRHQELPGRGHPAAYGHPPLSLTLHYLVTAYGASPLGDRDDVVDESAAQYVLGSAMRVLHDLPVITPALLCERPPRVGEPVLDPALLDACERVKVTPEPLAVDDLSKLWTALAQRLRLSAAYQVSVVQIESRLPRGFPRPVGEPPAAGPRIHVATLRRMEVHGVRVRRAGETQERAVPYARVGDTLVLTGTGFAGVDTRVALDALVLPPSALADDRLEVVVPDDVRPDGSPIAEADRLQPGPHVLSVVAPLGNLPDGLRSNAQSWTLVPHVTAPPTLDTSVVPRRVRLTGTRLWTDGLPGEVVVGRVAVPEAAYVTRTPTALALPLPDGLPARDVAALLSGPLADPVALPAAGDLEVRVGAETRLVALAGTRPLAEVAAAIERGVRNAPMAGAALRRFRAAAVDGRLVLLAGELAHPITVTPGPIAAALALDAAAALPGALSGVLRPFPALAAAAPALRLTCGGDTRVATLASRPTSLAEAAALVQAAVRAADAAAAFAQARVAVLGDQLLLLPGAPVGTVDVHPVPGTDETSAAALAFRQRLAVRVRVNGVESVDDRSVELPQ